ncbi:alpha/beta hydrolase family protein [Lichenifustis flavocetrariae]|uniref:Dienelactone hydrolase n=1 Tax=Lichenifustis flavocetrariae TaxID=2949735 RepID=A0AA42CMI4_9HYPH|nr:dienelactone hydrolase [Lichenifustis flavocetrariae]MCW6508417.1 dienelactone hydrolase [Lichenifustis flavocetrariae]
MGFRKLVLAAFGSIALLASSAPQAETAKRGVGVYRREVPSAERGRPLDVTVWYPAAPGGEEIVLGDTPFFRGTSARLDAPIADGRFPLVLLSHGAGLAGSAEALSWIAAPLAQRGFIVAAPTHPGNGGQNRSAAETMKLWLRPADITLTLDAMGRTSLFERHLAPNQIGVLGLSMGGGTALALAGARFDPQLLAAYCDVDARNPSLCSWVRQSGVDLHTMDMHDAGRDHRDERIRFAIAIDPAPADVFDKSSLSKIGIPVDLVNLGRPGEIPVTAQAADVAKAITRSQYAVIKDASHFSMFGECKPGAAEAAASEGIEEPICSDGAGPSRRAIHAQLVDMVEATIRRSLVTIVR